LVNGQLPFVTADRRQSAVSNSSLSNQMRDENYR
jgi:hypothetical protein